MDYSESPITDPDTQAQILTVFSEVNETRQQKKLSSQRYIHVKNVGCPELEAVPREKRSKMRDVIEIIHRFIDGKTSLQVDDPLKVFLLAEERKIDPYKRDFDLSIDRIIMNQLKSKLRLENSDSIKGILSGSFTDSEYKKGSFIEDKWILDQFKKDYNRTTVFKIKDGDSKIDSSKMGRELIADKESNARTLSAINSLEKVLKTDKDKKWWDALQVAANQTTGNAAGFSVTLVDPIDFSYNGNKMIVGIHSKQFPVEFDITRDSNNNITQVNVSTKLVWDARDSDSQKCIAEEVVSAQLSYSITLGNDDKPQISNCTITPKVREPKGLKEKFSLLIAKIVHWFKGFSSDYRNRFESIKTSLRELEEKHKELKDEENRKIEEARLYRINSPVSSEASLVAPSRADSNASIGQDLSEVFESRPAGKPAHAEGFTEDAS